MASWFYKYWKLNSKAFSDFLASISFKDIKKCFPEFFGKAYLMWIRSKGKQRKGPIIRIKSQVWIQALTVLWQKYQTVSLCFSQCSVFYYLSLQNCISNRISLDLAWDLKAVLQHVHIVCRCTLDFSLSLSSSLQCFLSAPQVQIERQLVRLVYFAKSINLPMC